MPPPLIFIAGIEGVGHHEIIECLAHDTRIKVEEQQIVRWEIDTKYYTASVHLQSWTLRPIEEGGGCSLDALAEPPEAIVLVFDKSREASFDALTAWVGENRTVIDNSVEVKLCVANHVKQRHRDSSEGEGGALADADPGGVDLNGKGMMTKFLEWCLEEGFEPVEISTSDASVDADLAASIEEPQGVPRVINALHSHMWSGLERKDPSAPQPLTTPDASQQHSHDCISEYTAQAVTSEDSFQKPQLQAEDLLEYDQRHPEEDEGMNKLEEVMRQVLHVRDTANAADMSDDARRNRAADMAMQLAALMGEDSSDGNGDDSD